MTNGHFMNYEPANPPMLSQKEPVGPQRDFLPASSLAGAHFIFSFFLVILKVEAAT
jgi:hypothetical protein